MSGAERKKVAVIAGGPSREAAVSRTSARGVVQGARAANWDAELVELDTQLATSLAGVDVAFPIAHGALGEDGCLQGMLEVLGVPYVGADVRASAMAAHKPTAKALFAARGLPLAQGSLVARAKLADLSSQVNELLTTLGKDLVVKPASGGSAIGVALLRATNAAELAQALEAALQTDDALVEQLHEGHEVTCAVLERAGVPEALNPTRIYAQAAQWYDFRSRYGTGGSRHECPAQLPEAVFRRVQEVAVNAHLALGCRDLSRVDFVVTDQGPILLEVNTLPGMTPTSLFPEAAAASGIEFPELCDLLLKNALNRPSKPRGAAPEMPE